MAEDQTNDANQNQDGTHPGVTVQLPDDFVEPENNTANTPEQQDGNSDEHKECRQVIKIVNETDNTANRIAKNANLINIIIGIINVGMLIATISVFYLSKEATEAATASTKIAKNSFDEGKRMNDISIANQDSVFKFNTKESIERSKHDNEVLDEQRRLVDAQIKQLIETQREFTIENRALVQIANVKINIKSFEENRKLELSYDVVDIGRSPAKILDGFWALKYKDNVFLKSTVFVNNSYVSTFGTAPFGIGGVIVNDDFYQDFILGWGVIELYGECIYYSMINDKTYKNVFSLAIKDAMGGQSVSILKNDDILLKDSTAATRIKSN